MGRECPDPESIADKDWEILHNFKTRNQRKRYCYFLDVKSRSKEECKEKRKQRKEESKSKRVNLLSERQTNDHIIYGLGHNSIFIRASKNLINTWRNIK